ncbi:transposase domain-containing protein [candidate division KSB1 bacterium]|nr:transposase domain-containing protein [candidate division KSB1 bacterium]
MEPFAYLRNILNRLPDHPINKIAELLPQNWRTPNS